MNSSSCFPFVPPLPGHAAWAPNPICRGTFEIISLCLSTVVICIWSSIHWDIPLRQTSIEEEDDAEYTDSDLNTSKITWYTHPKERLKLWCRNYLRLWKLECLKRWLKAGLGFLRQCRTDLALSITAICRFLEGHGPLVIVAIFFPAVLLFRAINQWISAHKLVEAVKASIRQHRNLRRSRTSSRQFKFTLVHGFYAIMGGFVVQLPPQLGGDPARISAEGLRFLIENEPQFIVPQILEVSITSITERAKSSSFGKTVMSFQVVWFCLSCASRLGENLPLSLLEVSTLAHGLCTLASCAVWWRKPLNIASPTYIKFDTERSRRALEYMYGRSFLTFESSPGFRNLFEAFSFDELDGYVLVSAFTPVIYGSLHFLGWHSQFPTTVERILWRIATVISMSPGVAAAASFAIFNKVTWPALSKCTKNEPGEHDIASRANNVVSSFLIPFVYAVGSAYLLLESIRQLWFLSPNAYLIATWSYYVPHLF